MIRIEAESDIERLRQVALLQQEENARLHKRLLQLTQELAVARGEDAILAIQQELAFLKEQLDARNRELFGASSEKRSRDKSGDAGSNGTTERTGHGRRTSPSCRWHVRRKFHDAEPAWPQATEMLELIGKLYAVEAEVADLDGDERRVRLTALRRERSKPIVDEIKAWLMNQAALPRSGLGKAIGYALSLWDGLERFVGRRAHSDRHESGRARHATRRGRSQEPLRLEVRARDARRRTLLHADRVGEARRRRAGRLPRRGHAATMPRITTVRHMGSGEHLRSTLVLFRVSRCLLCDQSAEHFIREAAIGRHSVARQRSSAGRRIECEASSVAILAAHLGGANVVPDGTERP